MITKNYNMSGIKRLLMSDTNGLQEPTNEMLAEESKESQLSVEEQSEKKN